ncbi:neuropeptide CCHamide-1 receptor-like [Daphnia carinata]|uniref:neuropeptide CCHamide-1 receptor-like n=1 Tax=Daphnia carinata TaxID=120202 RepID=UPI002580340F|nr:neuropeptide CCHamide-1 receptor-like [Daphnia carinata]
MAGIKNGVISTISSQQLELENKVNVSSNGYVDYSERPETYIVPLLFGVVFLAGVIGNGCLIIIFCRHKSMRNLPNFYIFNLAVGDLLVLLCSVPFTATIYTFDSWPYGEFACKASEFAKDTSVGVSVFTLTALSLDRYTAVVKPVESFVTNPKSKLFIIICIALIWLASVGLALPAVLFSHLLILDGEEIPETERIRDSNGTLMGPMYHEIFICYPFPLEFGPSYAKIVVVSRFLIHYCLPLLVIGIFYTIMARHLMQSVQDIPGQATLEPVSPGRCRQASETSNNSNRNRESRIKVAKMVQCFVVLFAICFLPMHIFFLWFHFDPNSRKNFNHFWNVFRIFGFVLAYTNSCINPIALYCVSTNFRKHFNRLLCCCNDDDVFSSGRRSRSLRTQYRRDGERSDVELRDTRPYEPTLSCQQPSCQSSDETC